MMKHKNTIKSMFGFIVFILISVTIFSKVTWLLRGNDEEAKTDLIGYKNQGNIDVVLYGGSTLLRFYSPLDAWNQTGMVAYNYATSSAKIDIVKEYIEESRTTNDALLYVIDIRTFPMVVDTVDDSSIRNWSDSLPIFSPVRWKGISSFLFTRNWKEADIPSFYFDIIKYHSNVESLAKASQWEYINTKNIYNIDKGYEPKLISVPLDKPKVIKDRGELTAQQENALNRLLDYCDDENLQVLFIVCPYYISEADWKILNTCGDIIQSRGYDYINFNNYYDEIGLDFEVDFSDTNHVNYFGAIKYTEYLTNYIKENYEIPDHRGEEYYAKWENDYETFASLEEQWYTELTDIIASHLEAKEIGQSLSSISDFNLWYQNIQNQNRENRNFTVMIRKNNDMNDIIINLGLSSFISEYGIDMSKEHYIGVWSGKKCLFSTNGDDSADVKIGVNRGRGSDKCKITTGADSQFMINDVDYSKTYPGIQVVIYDNNYKIIVDNVVIQVDVEGNIDLVRE